MNRFLVSRSLLLHFATWLFIALFSCDEVNVADLCPGFFVLHDDDDIAAGSSVACCGSVQARCNAPQESSCAPRVKQSGPLARFGVRVLIDQDSPSLAAGECRTVFGSLVSLPDASMSDSDGPPPTELLHLRFDARCRAGSRSRRPERIVSMCQEI
jgi:hypothetical protein